MKTIKDIYKLPVYIRRLIFQYDGTYKNIYNKVMEELLYFNTFKKIVILKNKYKQSCPMFRFKKYRLNHIDYEIAGRTLLTSTEQFDFRQRHYISLTINQIIKYFYIDDEIDEAIFSEDDENDNV